MRVGPEPGPADSTAARHTGPGGTSLDELWVECQAEPDAAPRRFGWGSAAREVREVLDRWDGEGHRYFRVRDDAGAVLILRQDLEARTWRLHFFEQGDSP